MKLISYSYKNAQHEDTLQSFALVNFLKRENIPWVGLVNHQLLENNIVVTGAYDEKTTTWPKQALFLGVHAPKQLWQQIDKTLVGVSNLWSQQQALQTGLNPVLTGEILITLPPLNSPKTQELFINSKLKQNDEEQYPLKPQPSHYLSWETQLQIAQTRLEKLAQAYLVHTSDYTTLVACIAMGIPVDFERTPQTEDRLSFLLTLTDFSQTLELSSGLKENLLAVWKNGFQTILSKNKDYLKLQGVTSKKAISKHIERKIERKIAPVVTQPPPATETAPTAVITVIYGQKNKSRINANNVAMKNWLKQDLPATLFIEELLFPGDDNTCYQKTVQQLKTKFTVHYSQHQGTEANQDLFQKECMFNRQAKLAVPTHQVLIFIDADVWSEETTWWTKICKQTLAKENMLVQGYSFFTDTEDKTRDTWSIGSETAENPVIPQTIGYRHPGFIWSMQSNFYTAIHGWNEWFISGAGDVALLAEMLPNCGYCTYLDFLVKLDWVKGILRYHQPQGQLGFVHVPIIHQNHGTMKSRAYYLSRKVIEWTATPIQELVVKDTTGFLAWKNPKHKLKLVLSHKNEIEEDEHKMIKTCEKFGLVNVNKVKPIGWYNWPSVYRKFVDEAPENSILVELGVFAGASLIPLASYIQNSGKNIKVYAFDVFPTFKPQHQHFSTVGFNGDTYTATLANLKAAGVDQHVVVQKLSMHEAYKQFAKESIFAVWLDADHTEKATQLALEEWFPLVQHGGYFGGDDYVSQEFAGVRIATDSFFNKLNIPVEIYHQYVFLTKKP